MHIYAKLLPQCDSHLLQSGGISQWRTNRIKKELLLCRFFDKKIVLCFVVIEMGKHRTRLQILESILSVINDNKEVRKTQIMYKAYLSYSLLTRYLSDVMKSGLVVCNAEDYYVLTQKGEKFLLMFGQYDRSRDVISKKMNNIEDQKLTLEEMCPTSEVDKHK